MKRLNNNQLMSGNIIDSEFIFTIMIHKSSKLTLACQLLKHLNEHVAKHPQCPENVRHQIYTDLKTPLVRWLINNEFCYGYNNEHFNLTGCRFYIQGIHYKWHLPTTMIPEQIHMRDTFFPYTSKPECFSHKMTPRKEIQLVEAFMEETVLGKAA